MIFLWKLFFLFRSIFFFFKFKTVEKNVSRKKVAVLRNISCCSVYKHFLLLDVVRIVLITLFVVIVNFVKVATVVCFLYFCPFLFLLLFTFHYSSNEKSLIAPQSHGRHCTQAMLQVHLAQYIRDFRQKILAQCGLRKASSNNRK